MIDRTVYEDADKLLDEARRVFDSHAFAAGFYKSLSLSLLDYVDEANQKRFIRQISDTLNDLQNGKFGK